ncbi:MAG: hypothetical protein ACLPUT_04845 [Solirubrobacteraceae bacterium]
MLVLAPAAAFTGCGGSSSGTGASSSSAGIASQSAAEIFAASQAAAKRATSVHVLGTISQGGLSLTTDLQLASDGGRAKLSLLGLRYEVIRIGNTLYVKGDATLDRRLERRTGLRLPRGRWLEGPADTGSLDRLAGLTELGSRLDLLLASAGPLTKGAVATIDGQASVELKQTAKLFTGSLYIATTGEPYPIEIVKHGQETGKIAFSGWNEPIALSAPANAIELSKLKRGAAR